MTAKNQRGTSDRLRWLAELGCPVNVLKDESPVTIEQQCGDDATLLFELPDGRTGVILDLAIVNEGPGTRCVRDLDFKMPWSDFGFQLLQDPKETGGRRSNNLYRFPADSLAYHRDLVLNHVLLPDGVLKPHLPKRGLLLGVGNPLSAHIPHGATFTGTLTVFIEGANPSSSDIELWVDRSMNQPRSVKKRPAGYDGLYGDKIRSRQAPAYRLTRDFHDDGFPDPASRDAAPDEGDLNKRRR
jgi:hypothetical protein